MVSRIASHNAIITINASNGDFNPKKMTGHNALRASCALKKARAVFFPFALLSHTI